MVSTLELSFHVHDILYNKADAVKCSNPLQTPGKANYFSLAAKCVRTVGYQ